MSSGSPIEGNWSTGSGEIVRLKLTKKTREFEGQWGVHKLCGKVDGVIISDTRLGETNIVLSGEMSADFSEIRWGSGQIWKRS